MTSPDTRSLNPFHGLTKPGRRAFLAAGIGWGLDGFDWTMYSFALVAIMASLNLTLADAGYIATAALIASAIGGVVGGLLADRFGRTRVLTFVILGYAVTTAMTATSQDGTQLTIWRTLQGFAFGSEWAVGAALLAEYARPETRGRLMGVLQSCYALGWAASTAAYLILFSVLPDGSAWRWLFALGALPAIAAFFVRRHTEDNVEPTATPYHRSIASLFTRRQAKITLLAMLLGVAVQGIYYSVFIYLPLFLQTVRHLSIVGTASYTWAAVVGSFLGYALAGYLHDAIGRRRAFSIYFLGAAAAIALFTKMPVSGTMMGLSVTFLLGFFASGQAAGLGAYLAELFPTEIRATGQGFAYNVGRGLAAAAPTAVATLTGSFGLANAILLIGCIAATLGLLVVWALPETNGLAIRAETSMAPGESQSLVSSRQPSIAVAAPLSGRLNNP